MFHSIISKLIKNLQASLKDLEDLKDEASSVGIGSSSTGIGSSSVGIGSSSVGIGSSSTGIGSSSVGIGSSSVGIGSSSTGIGSSSINPSEGSTPYEFGHIAEYSGDQVFWPRFKYLEGEIVGNLTKTRTMGLDDSGVIHSLGYKSDMHIETDTSKDSIKRNSVGYKGFIGNVEASDGYTYFLPAYQTSIGKLGRKTGSVTLEKKFTSCPQVRSGAEGNDGIIYMPSYTKTLKIFSYNTNTGEVASTTPQKPSRYTFCNHIWGAAVDKKGEIYMPQTLGTSIAKIDKFGVFSYLDGPPVTSGVSGWTHKYVGATYVESVDKVFCLPRQGKKILIINCADDTYEEVDLPADYLAVANKNKNFHGFLAPDGWLYSAFWADTKCFRINPRTYEIQWKDYEYEFMDGHLTAKDGSGIMSLGTGYSTAALVQGDDVYLGLAGTSRAIKLEF